jgi:PAS domain S-box-containing protein
MRTFLDRLRRYGFAVLTVALLGAVMTIPEVQDRAGTPILVYFFAVLLSAWYGGFGPGLLTTGLIILLSKHTFFPFWRVLRLTLGISSGVAISALAESLHVARRRAEDSEHRLAAVLTSIADAVIATDTRGRITFINPIAQTLTGWEREEAVGKPLETVFRVRAEGTNEPIESPVARVLREGTIVGLGNHTILAARDGTERPIDESAAPIHDEGKPISGVVLVFRDVTEREQHEAERERLLAAQREARDLAEAANQAKDRFLAVLSHELRTPLTPVLLTVSNLLDDPQTPSEFRPTLELTRHNIELEARLIDNLLDLTQIARGELVMHPRTINAHALIEQALTICREDLREAGHRLTLDLKAAEHHVEADPARLLQVLWNLLKNATRFTPAGGVLTVGTHNRGDGAAVCRLVIEVSDNGIGIAPEVLPRIFDAFEQGENSSWSRRSGGLGLGLSISRSIVEALGGCLVATSAGPYQGATFTLDLAVVPAPASEAAEQPLASRHPPAARGLRILLVEDDEATMRAMARLLQIRGHVVLTAQSLAAGLEAAANEEFDLLISDLGLPDGNGLELMRNLREQRPVKAIAVSGFGMDEDVRECHAAGFAAHLTKPVDFQKLETTIQRVTAGAGQDGIRSCASQEHRS